MSPGGRGAYRPVPETHGRAQLVTKKAQGQHIEQ